MAPWLNWIEQPPPKRQVRGSNPLGNAKFQLTPENVMTDLLFPKDALPRTAQVKRMRVADAGHMPAGGKGIRFECPHCDHDTGWIEDK